VAFPYLPQPKLVLDLAIQEGREHLGPVRVTVLGFRNMVTVRVIRGQMSMMVFLVGEGSGVRGHSGVDVGGGQMSYIPTTQPPKPLRHLQSHSNVLCSLDDSHRRRPGSTTAAIQRVEAWHGTVDASVDDQTAPRPVADRWNRARPGAGLWIQERPQDFG